jgi:tripeptidyl-peptidase-1
LVCPDEDTIREVEGWLSHHGIDHHQYSLAKDWITVPLRIQEIERLPDATYNVYSNEEDGSSLVRAPQWSLPEHLHGHIETIQPTNSFFRTKPQGWRAEPPEPQWFLDGRLPTHQEMVDEDLLDRGHIDIPELENLPSNPTAAQACNRLAVSPLCLRTLYGALGYAAQVPENNSIGLVNYHRQSNNRSDSDLFLKLYRKDAAAANAAYTFKTEIVTDGQDEQTPATPEQLKRMDGFEGALDIQAVLGVGFPTPVTAYNVGGRPPFREDKYTTLNNNKPYLEWLQYIIAQDDVPRVITTSYADDEQTVPESYARRACNEFAQLGARGVSVIFASGDQGVGRDGYCKSNDGSAKTRFLPVFPASCPYVTSVGATRLVGPEIVAFDARGGFVSGGGFSNYFSRPLYQDKAVELYLQSLDNSLDMYYNKEGL